MTQLSALDEPMFVSSAGSATSGSRRYTAMGLEQFMVSPYARHLSPSARFELRVVSQVLPFRVNSHLLETLVDWGRAPDDPLYRLLFPARAMLSARDFDALATALDGGQAEPADLRGLVAGIRRRLNPHPAGQMEHNVPWFDGAPLAGAQHKYRETILLFPSRGQTCHAYCAFCFRWPQFVGDRALRFAARTTDRWISYLTTHREITDVLITGGDPLIMATRNLEAVIDPLLSPRLAHITTVRLGTKTLTFWPRRYIDDPDADVLLRLFERITRAGKHLALMVHVNHPRELDNAFARSAISRLRGTGATLRSQAPLLAGINDDPATWAENWRLQVHLGIQPYYMFVARDTGPSQYFAVPLHRAYSIYRNAQAQVSGLARTARGPVMSATPGKAEIMDVQRGADVDRYLLQFLQARDPRQVRQPFLATAPSHATWFDDLSVETMSCGRFHAPRPADPSSTQPISLSS